MLLWVSFGTTAAVAQESTFVQEYLERLEIKDNQVVYREKLLDGMGRVRNVRQAPDGFIYISIEGKGIYRLEPK